MGRIFLYNYALSDNDIFQTKNSFFMKKILLLSATAMMASAAFAVEPQIYDELYSVGISPDGKTMVSATETTFTIVILETAKRPNSRATEQLTHIRSVRATRFPLPE